MFVQPPSREPDWDSVDAKNLFDFLNGETGKRFVERLLWERPRYGDRLDRLVDSGKIEGYEECLENAFSLCELVKPPKDVSETYPDLDRDEAWKFLENPQE